MSIKVERFFSAKSPLAAEVDTFRPREQQRDMALAVAAAIRDNAILIAEAGTGTGKTFAYLVPALLNGGKVIISTGTKNLQDQLFQKDLPKVRDALKAPVAIALLKGRANYVCHYHLERALSDGRFATREDLKHLAKIKQYAKISDSGDKSGLADVSETAPIWMHVTSTRDNCLGQECPNHKECFVLKARTEAMKADIVVVNHHLFFADVMLRDEGVAELLPACNTVIFDEAHQLVIPDGTGLRQLERGVLVGLHGSGTLPANWGDLMAQHAPALACYSDYDCELPIDTPCDEITDLTTRFTAACGFAGIHLAAVRARLVYPREFNELTTHHGNKGAALSHVSIGLSREVMEKIKQGCSPDLRPGLVGRPGLVKSSRLVQAPSHQPLAT